MSQVVAAPEERPKSGKKFWTFEHNSGGEMD
jgi:hypothetical protein